MRTVQQMTVALTLILTMMLSAPSQSAEPAPFTEAELDQMLAPVALYPDTVLSHVLIAATYPLEVVQAARWSRHNPSLRGEEAVAAVDHKDWDPSVKALVAFPELVARMDEDLDWTQRLGDAFLMQEEDVIDTVQYLRSEAYAQGHLRSNEHVRVVRETQYIYIEPARTRVVYVPYYDPRVVYTRWRWASHPPVYWRHPPAYRSSVVFYWGPAYRVAPTFYFSSFHWSRRQVVSVHHHHHYHHHRHVHTHRHFSSGREIARYGNARHWQHNPVHRRGVSYRPGVDQRRFVQTQRDDARSASLRSASTRASSPQRVRTVGQQRQWADQQRAAAPLRERAQTRSQTPSRSAGTSPAQRGQAGRVQRQPASGNRPVTQQSGNVRSEASRQGSSATRPDNRIQRQAQTDLAASARSTDSTRGEATPPRTGAVRSGQTAGSQSSPNRAANPRPSSEAGSQARNPSRQSSPARTSRPDSRARSASRASAAPSRESSQPQAQAPQSSRQSATSSSRTQAATPRPSRSTPAPSRSQSSGSSAPSRSSSPPSRSSSSRSTPPRESSSSNRTASRGTTSSRGSNPQRRSNRQDRHTD